MPTPPTVPERRVPDDDAVAWELAGAAHPHLSRSEADRIYIALGVGDGFDAIAALLTAVARDRIPLEQDLLATVATWLDRYRGHDAEPRLRQVYAEIEHQSPQPISAFEQRCGSALTAARDRRSG